MIATFDRYTGVSVPGTNKKLEACSACNTCIKYVLPTSKEKIPVTVTYATLPSTLYKIMKPEERRLSKLIKELNRLV
jgi:hypothetical protein